MPSLAVRNLAMSKGRSTIRVAAQRLACRRRHAASPRNSRRSAHLLDLAQGDAKPGPVVEIEVAVRAD